MDNPNPPPVQDMAGPPGRAAKGTGYSSGIRGPFCAYVVISKQGVYVHIYIQAMDEWKLNRWRPFKVVLYVGERMEGEVLLVTRSVKPSCLATVHSTSKRQVLLASGEFAVTEGELSVVTSKDIWQQDWFAPLRHFASICIL